MSKQDNGGPAFPAHPSALGDHDGMTLCDYFAAKWVQGFVANPDTPNLSFESAANAAYRMADAMIAERAK